MCVCVVTGTRRNKFQWNYKCQFFLPSFFSSFSFLSEMHGRRADDDNDEYALINDIKRTQITLLSSSDLLVLLVSPSSPPSLVKKRLLKSPFDSSSHSLPFSTSRRSSLNIKDLTSSCAPSPSIPAAVPPHSSHLRLILLLLLLHRRQDLSAPLPLPPATTLGGHLRFAALVVLLAVRKRISVLGLAEHFAGQAHRLISENLAAPAVPRSGSSGGRGRGHGRKVRVHFDVRQMALEMNRSNPSLRSANKQKHLRLAHSPSVD